MSETVCDTSTILTVDSDDEDKRISGSDLSGKDEPKDNIADSSKDSLNTFKALKVLLRKERKQNLKTLWKLLKLSVPGAGTESCLPKTVMNNFKVKPPSISSECICFEKVSALVLENDLVVGLKLSRGKPKYVTIPFSRSEGIKIGNQIRVDLEFRSEPRVTPSQGREVDSKESRVLCKVTKISETSKRHEKGNDLQHKTEQSSDQKESPTCEEQDKSNVKQTVTKIHDIKLTVLIHLLVSQNHAQSLKTLYSKMSKPYKETSNFSSFKEEIEKCKFFKIYRNSNRKRLLLITLKLSAGLEYLLNGRTNVKVVKNRKFSPPIKCSLNPLIKKSDDKKTLRISNIKANISGEKSVFLKISEQSAFKVETKQLNMNLTKGVNQNIVLTFDLKRIYVPGMCLVEMDTEDTEDTETASQDTFLLNEELLEDLAANPFLTNPAEEIVNLSDSDDDREESENEELLEDFAANPFLTNPAKEIANLRDSDDDGEDSKNEELLEEFAANSFTSNPNEEIVDLGDAGDDEKESKEYDLSLGSIL